MDIRQLLAQGYQAADRFLPFDGVLDPMFAPPPRRQMPQDVGAMPNMQSRFAPQQPAPMPQQMPAPVQAPRRGGNDFGRTLMEFIDPSFNRRADERSAAMAGQQQRAAFAQWAQQNIADPLERQIAIYNPEGYLKAKATGLEAYTLTEGGVRGQGRDVLRSVPRTMQDNNNFYQADPETGGVKNVLQGPASLSDQVAQRRLEFDISQPKIVTTSPGQYVVAVSPGAPGAAPPADALFESLIKTESGGRPGILGPMTDYGQAQGLTQMLPETAQAMAQKLGVPWKPELMTGTSPEAADYQRTLGRAYFDEGMQKYGGDPVKALMYYHGGPNEALWGPKTQAYAQNVLRGASGPSAQVVASGGAKPQYQPATAQQKRDAGVPVNLPYQRAPDGKLELIDSPATKPLPVGIQKAEDDDYVAIDGHQVIADQLGGFINQLKTGALNLGLVRNEAAKARTYMGRATAEDRNYNSFVSGMKKMRDDSLALNNGTQTEGDAIRAWEQLFANMNDEGVVAQRLNEIQAVNARAVRFRQQQIDRRRTRNGAEPVFGTAQAATPPAPPPRKPPPVNPKKTGNFEVLGVR